ncbi:uncharacterized protein METZ01_LOCUS493087, partial [marine metagenome]
MQDLNDGYSEPPVVKPSSNPPMKPIASDW